nr:immunoglobulin light chain junction region [Macaca mulatta]MOY14202.1 immunoglobulin light chain junction region [Macaca mulatta]
CQQYHDFLSF